MSTVFPEQRMSIVTLGVTDLAESKQFYEHTIGLKPFMTDGITMFDMGGFVLGLWERDKLHKDIGIMGNTCPKGACPNFAMAYNARSREEVDEIFSRLGAGGVDVPTEPHEADWGGYSGYFTDPDGNAWEVAFNPYWPVKDDGRLELPVGEAS